jgi:SAM-dependent methyltransferase
VADDGRRDGTMGRLRRSLKALLLRAGLYGAFWKLRGHLKAYHPRTLISNRRWRQRHPDAPPVPPPRLIYDVINVYEIEAFIASGKHTADKIEHALATAGRPLGSFTRVLDFGCGCGRVLRHFCHREHALWHGSDYNAELIAWCEANLPAARCVTNRLAPPLDFAPGSFDLVYANSVFTHLDEELQCRWLEEMLRVLDVRGALLLTTHGDAWVEGLDADEQARYRRGEIIVRSAGASGSNLCETYHPASYFRPLTERLFRRVHHLPMGSPEAKEQDVWVLEV